LLCRTGADTPARVAAGEVERLFEGGMPLTAIEPLDIPTFTVPFDAGGLRPFPWDDAAHHAIVVFIDDPMYAESDIWGPALDRLVGEANAHGALILTVSDDARSLGNLSPALAGKQIVRVPRADPRAGSANPALAKKWASTTLLHLLRELAGRLALPDEGRGRLFLSHAKADGYWLAVALRDFVQQHLSDATFFDAVNLRAGDDFEPSLLAAFDGAVVVALITDQYSARYWCNWEVVTGKYRGCPFLAVDLLTEGEARSLRYGGNARTMRWPLAIPEPSDQEQWAPREGATDPTSEGKRFALQRIVQAALAELVRWRHDRARIEAARATTRASYDVTILGGPPELATLPPFEEGRKRWDIVHPDPPLPVPERDLILRLRPDVRALSLTEALAGWAATSGGRRMGIALSISEAPDLSQRGLAPSHLRRLWARLALQLLLVGAKLGYGGDLRKQGYTELLGDLLMSLSSVQRGPPEAVVDSYLGWPTWVGIDASEFKHYPRSIRWHRMLLPGGLQLPEDANPAPSWTNPEEQLGWTVGMRAMRERVAREYDARVMLGGQLRAVSPMPGLVDEVTTFLDLGKPVYLLGGFGGMTAVLTRAIMGESPHELTLAFQDDGGRRTAIREYIDHAVATRTFTDPGDRGAGGSAAVPLTGLEPTDFGKTVERLRAAGIAGLNNGLTEDENRVLFRTRDAVEAVSLVLRGLMAVGQRDAGATIGAQSK
jgi:hypothetical protein